MIPVKHGEGSWYGDPELVAELEARGQIALRYTDDVNGAVDRIAGVTNEAGNVLGLMPHPEHAVDPLLGPTGGVPVLEGLIGAARTASPRMVAVSFSLTGAARGFARCAVTSATSCVERSDPAVAVDDLRVDAAEAPFGRAAQAVIDGGRLENGP